MILTIFNEKGGDGKTSLSILASLELAKQGYRVLAVDCDSQANLTKFLVKFLGEIYSKEGLEPFSINNHLKDHNTKTISIVKNLSFVPATTETQKLIEWMNVQDERDFLFYKMLEAKKDSYDIAILDLPPTRSIITTNAYYCVSNLVLIASLEEFSISGAANLIKAFFKVKNSTFCPQKGGFEGVVLNKINASKKIGNKEMKKSLEEINVIASLSETTAVPQSQMKGANLFEYSLKSKSKNNFEKEFNKFLNHIKTKIKK